MTSKRLVKLEVYFSSIQEAYAFIHHIISIDPSQKMNMRMRDLEVTPAGKTSTLLNSPWCSLLQMEIPSQSLRLIWPQLSKLSNGWIADLVMYSPDMAT